VQVPIAFVDCFLETTEVLVSEQLHEIPGVPEATTIGLANTLELASRTVCWQD
jgi:hypothetical protein